MVVKKYFFTAGLVLGGLLAGNAKAALVAGGVVGFDVGATASAGGTNFNDFGNATGTPSIAVGSVIDTSGNIVTGVGIEFTADPGDLVFSVTDGNIGPIDPAVSALGFDSTHAIDFAGDQADKELEFRFTGLDDTLTYNFVGVSAFDLRDLEISYTADGQTIAVDTTSASPFASFTGLSTDGSGNLLINVESTSSDVGVINAGMLTAVAASPVPEPNSLVILLGVGGLIVFTRRRRCTLGW